MNEILSFDRALDFDVSCINVEFNSSKDNGYLSDIQEYLGWTIRELYNAGENEVAELLKNGYSKLIPNGSAYTKAKNKFESPFFNEITTEQNTVKQGYLRAIISVCGKNSKNKWIDLAINITSANNMPVSEEMYKKIIVAFNRVNTLRALPKLKKVSSQVTLHTQGLVSAAIETVGSKAPVELPIQPLSADEEKTVVNIASTILPPTIIDKRESSEVDSTIMIPDQLLNRIIYFCHNDPHLEKIWENQYFISEKSVESMLKDGAVYEMDKWFITESAIRKNLPLAFAKRHGSFHSVMRLDVDQYNQNQSSYSPKTKDQLELLSSWLQSYKVWDKKLQYIRHNAEDLRIALEETSSDTDLRGFYQVVNRGSTRETPIIKKWYLFTIPSDYNEVTHEENTLRVLENDQLKDKIKLANQRIQALKEESKDIQIKIDELNRQKIQHQADLREKEGFVLEYQGQSEWMRIETIKSYNSIERIPSNSSIEQLTKYISESIGYLQELESNLNAINYDSEKETNLKYEIESLKQNIENIDTETWQLLETREAITDSIMVLEKKINKLTIEKDRRVAELQRTLQLLAE